jgi:uncharacterized protein YcbK (DUF882 family)
VEAPQSDLTVILLTHPGAPARQLKLPRAWPVFLGIFSILSICGSLAIGRQARALCAPEPPALELSPPRALVEEGSLLSAAVHSGPRPLAGLRSFRAPSPRPAARAAASSATRIAPTRAGVEARGSAREQNKNTELLTVSGKRLSLYDINAGRALKVTPFGQDGLPDPTAFAQLRTFLRCRRSGHEMDMDPRLIALLSRIAQHFGDATLQIISAHRKPDGKVTRETSQHAFGTAADIRIAGVSIEQIKEAAHQLGARGVGLYTKSQFVHVDVRAKPYAWRDDGDGEDHHHDETPVKTVEVTPAP